MSIYQINPNMYYPVDNPDLQLGWFSKTWVRFTSGEYKGKDVLMKVPLSEKPRKDAFIFLKNPELSIQLDELNSLVAEVVSLEGDPDGECAKYFLAQEDGKEYICTPSFIQEGEELINGSDLLPHEHQALSRVNPEDALIIAEDLKLDLLRRKVPEDEAEKCKAQFLKDCFKLAYFGMFDPNNSNWSILYKEIGRARNAPLYDLDMGFNIPLEYGDEIPPEIMGKISGYLEDLSSGRYLKRYIEIFSAGIPWFDEFLANFYKRVSRLDIQRKLLEKKGIDIDTVALDHYRNFFGKQNTVLRDHCIDKKMIKPNVVIAFSGIDGSGKTTQLEMAQNALEASGLRARIIKLIPNTRPDMTSNDCVDNKARMLSICEQLSEYYNNPNLGEDSDVLLCDRHVLDYKSLAQLIGVLDEDVAAKLGETPPADLTVFLNCNIDTSLGRIQKRAEEKPIDSHENRTTLSKLKASYVACISEQRASKVPVVIMNAEDPIESIHGQVMTRIREVLISKGVIEKPKCLDGNDITVR